MHTHYDSEDDGFNETASFYFDVGTWPNYNQTGYLKVIIHDSFGFWVDDDSIWFDVNGNVSDPFFWEWAAELTDTYNFTIELWNEDEDILLHRQNHTIFLDVVYEAAWFETKTFTIADNEGDGFNETVSFYFDIGTWHNYTQTGYLDFMVYDSNESEVYNTSLTFDVTGNGTDGIFWLNWSADYSDDYTVMISLYNHTYYPFHHQNHTIELFVYELPIATIVSIIPNPAGEDEAVDFNGTGDSPYGDIVEYRWWIDGEVVASGSYAGTAAAFGIAAGELVVGGHAVAFQVRDEFGSWSENDSAALIIKDTTPPQLGLLVEPDYDVGKIMIYLRANEPLGTLKVELDDHGSRTVHVIAMTPDSPGDLRNYTGSHGTVAPGNYTVTVTANDTAGNTATTTSTARIQQVTVTPDKPVLVDNKDNANTTIEIHTKNETSGNISVSRTTSPAPNEAEAGLKELNIYVSIDIDDELLDELDYVNITIYYNPDELPEDQPEEGLKLYHFVESNQTWVVVNPHGVNNVSNYVWGHVHDFSVFGVFGANVAPTANAGPNIEAAVGEEITFHGSAYDMDGTIASYEWDFDEDGVWDAFTADATWTYNQSGRYLVKLRVTDDKGSTSFDTVLVEVGKEDEGGTTLSLWVILGVGATGVAIAAVVIFLRRTQ